MGKGARLPKRTREIAESEHILSSSAIESKQDEDLFMIDVTGDEQVYKKKRRELNTGVVSSGGNDSKQKLKIASKQEEKKIQQLVKKKNKGAVPVIKKDDYKQPFDLWDDKPINTKKMIMQASSKKQAGIAPVLIQTNVPQPKVVTTLKKKKDGKDKYTEQNIKKKQIAVDVAHPGQSYKPDEEHHKEAISQAVQIELKRDEIVKYKNTPISNGLSKETLDVLITNSDDEESDNDDSNEDTSMSTNNNNIILKKKKEKLTRAQRNAQKRHKERVFLHKKNKKSLKYLRQFNIIKKIAKGIDTHEETLKKKRERLEQIKKDKENMKLGTDVWMSVDALKVASFPVGLSDEVKKESASLRSIIPKGSLLVDRAYSMSSRNMLNLNKKGNFS